MRMIPAIGSGGKCPRSLVEGAHHRRLWSPLLHHEFGQFSQTQQKTRTKPGLRVDFAKSNARSAAVFVDELRRFPRLADGVI